MRIKTRVMGEEDLELADDFIARNFYIDEPIVLANNIPFTPKGLNKLFLRQRASIVAYDVETGSVVGMAINDTENKERRCYTLSTDDEKVGKAGGGARENRTSSRASRSFRVMFQIARATEDDVRGAHDLFVRSLYADEPLIAANGPHVLPGWSDGVASAVIAQGRSIVARDASGEVVGCALVDEPPQAFPYIYTHDEADVKGTSLQMENCLETVNDAQHVDPSGTTPVPVWHHSPSHSDTSEFQHMFEHMEDMSDVQNVAPDAIEIRYLAVDKAWRGRGIAQAIVEASMEAARQGGFRWFKMYTTSYFSNLLMIKMKWKRLYSLSYKEYVTEFKSDIKIPAEPHTHCNLYIYDLKSEEQN